MMPRGICSVPFILHTDLSKTQMVNYPSMQIAGQFNRVAIGRGVMIPVNY